MHGQVSPPTERIIRIVAAVLLQTRRPNNVPSKKWVVPV